MIKDFAFSTVPPSDKLSTDGVHVGVLGYSWNTVTEELFLGGSTYSSRQGSQVEALR